MDPGFPMATKMHRLQISLTHAQARYLEARARRDGVSMAEIIRRLIERESAEQSGSADGLWEIAGIAEDRGAIHEGVAVSENPELYLAGPKPRPRKKRRP
jgi:hypothetical protein